jgi:hypothetical protein
LRYDELLTSLRRWNLLKPVRFCASERKRSVLAWRWQRNGMISDRLLEDMPC